jgi:hypothetical protein
MAETEWSGYGTGRNPKCAQCMAHCGYEPTAVNDALRRPLAALDVFLRGPKTEGPMIEDEEVARSPQPGARVIPLARRP